MCSFIFSGKEVISSLLVVVVRNYLCWQGAKTCEVGAAAFDKRSVSSFQTFENTLSRRSRIGSRGGFVASVTSDLNMFFLK